MIRIVKWHLVLWTYYSPARCTHSTTQEMCTFFCWHLLCFGYVATLLSVNSKWLSDIIWLYRSGSTIAQACFLNKKYWVIMKGILWHSLANNLSKSAYKLNSLDVFRGYNLKIITSVPRGQLVNVHDLLLFFSVASLSLSANEVHLAYDEFDAIPTTTKHNVNYVHSNLTKWTWLQKMLKGLQSIIWKWRVNINDAK